MVAILDLRLARLHHRGVLCVHDRSHWRNLSHLVPRCEPILFWNMGCFVVSKEIIFEKRLTNSFQAGLQPRNNGLCLVWCARLDWRDLCLPHDPVYLEQLARARPSEPGCRGYSQRHPQLWNPHGSLCLFPLLLAGLAAFPLPSSPQNSPPVHSQSILCSDRRNRLLHLGYSASQGTWSYRSSAPLPTLRL
jgi:hypothetical protein